MTFRPRRSVLYMPGSNARAIEKARTLPADGVILDLEDAVAPEAKEQARQQVVDAVKAGGFGGREVFIRVNGLDTPWHADDLSAAAHARPDAILVPKVGSVATLERVGQRLLDMKTDLKTRVWAMIETPEAIFNINALAAEAHDSESRLAGFVMGTNDLAKETRARLVPGRGPMLSWLSRCLLAAHAHGIDILDGVYNNLSDLPGFEAECAQARDMGFDGKTLIHPNQIGPCNAVFSPSEDELAWARAVIAGFALPENQGKGAIQVEGKMVELLHLEQAQRLVAVAEQIAAG
jgi:citrate lyase subunit beta/citryl-CoA lyase